MRESSSRFQLLRRLTDTPGVAGREAHIRKKIEWHIRDRKLFDEIRIDALGTLIGHRRPRPKSGRVLNAPKRVVVAAHMDQIGFLVSHIGKDGSLRLHAVGSFDPRTLFARRVTVCTEHGEKFPGVINPTGCPIHTASPESLKQVPELSDFYVDLGLPAEQVHHKVSLGDMVAINEPVRHVGEFITGHGLDNRVGCWALIAALEQLTHHDCEIYSLWTSQEEVGSRGVEAAVYGLHPDVGIACDTVVSNATPGIAPEQQVCQPGSGVALLVADSSTLADIDLIRDAEAAARAHDIRCQRSLMTGGGQDGAMIQRACGGVRTLVMSCPLKHMHSTVEMVHTDDLESYRDLLARLLGTL